MQEQLSQISQTQPETPLKFPGSTQSPLDTTKRGCYTSPPRHSHVLSPEASPIAIQSSTEQSHDMDLSGNTLIDLPPLSLPSLDTQKGGWHSQLSTANI